MNRQDLRAYKQQQNGTAPAPETPAVQLPAQLRNPMDYINPYYTQQQPTDALAPLLMLQQFRQTGQMPGQNQGFTPYSVPGLPQAQTPTAPTAAPVAQGGK